MLANSESKLMFASINQIFKVANENKELIQSKFSLLIAESFADFLADSEYHSDKELLFRFIFNVSNTVDIKTCLSNGVNIIKYMIHNMNNSMNFDRLKLNLYFFNLSEVSKLFLQIIQNQESSINLVINTIKLIQNLTVNAPELKIQKIDKLLSVALEIINAENWEDLSLICNFLDDYHFNKELQSLLNEKVPSDVKNKFLSLIPIEERTVDDFISVAIDDPNLEKNDSVLDDLFRKMMNEMKSAIYYLNVLVDRFATSTRVEPEMILQNYYDEYLKYGDLFIKAIDMSLLYHPNKKKFVINPKTANLEFENSDFVDTLLSKLFQIANENPKKYQVFLILKSIACTFPFVFVQNIERIFTFVLPALDNYSLVFDEEFQKNTNNNNENNNDDNNNNNIINIDNGNVKLLKIKAAVTAFSFLVSALRSTKVLDAFCSWLFKEIQNFSNSQVYCFTLIMQMLLESKTMLPFMSVITKRIDIIANLIKRDMPDSSFSTEYYNHLFELLKELYIISRDIGSDVLVMDELSLNNSPFCHYFNYNSTTIPYNYKLSNDHIKSEIISKFCEEIERNRSFWFMYYVTKQKQSISADQISQFIEHFKRVVNVHPLLQEELELKSLDYPRTEKMHRLAIRKGLWIYNYLYHYSSFPLLPLHFDIIDPVIKESNKIQEGYSHSVYGMKTEKYFTFLLENKSLYQVLFDKIVKSNKTNLTKLNSLFSLYSTNKTCTSEMLSYCTNFFENMREKNDNGFILLTTIDTFFPSLRNFSNSSYFQSSTGFLFIEKIVSVAMRPQYRTNRNFLLKLSQLMSMFNENKLYVSVSHIIGFMLLFEDEEMIRKSILLCSKYDYKKLSHLSIIQDVYDREIQKKNISPLIITDFCNLFPCVTRARKLETLSVLESVLHKYADHFISNKDKEIYVDLIFAILDVLVPSRDAVNSFSMSDTSTIELKVGNRKFTFQPIPDFVRSSYPQFWALFDEHRATIFDIYDKRKEILHSCKVFSEYPELFDFKIRLTYFRDRMEQEIDFEETTYVNVQRDDILGSTLKSFEEEEEDEDDEEDEEEDKKDNLKKWKQEIEVTYENEDGIDEGGLTKDWFTNISKALFDPELGLFVEKEKTRSYQPNPLSSNLKYFRFAGRLIARAIIEGINIEFHLTQPFIKQILHRRICLNDFENVDPIKFSSFKQILDSDIDNDPISEYYFEVTKEGSDGRETVELKPNGSQIKVTNETKSEFINLVSNYYLHDSIKDQIEAFCSGFDELISHRDIRIFSAGEFDMLLCGIPFIDVKDMRKNVNFEGNYSSETPVVKLFFKAIEKWEQANLAKLLLFITGSPVVPIGGFKNEVITIGPGEGRNYLPRSHTCYSKIDLPQYEEEDELNEKLMLAINEESFSLV